MTAITKSETNTKKTTVAIKGLTSEFVADAIYKAVADTVVGTPDELPMFNADQTGDTMKLYSVGPDGVRTKMFERHWDNITIELDLTDTEIE